MHLRARAANRRFLPLAPSRKRLPSGLHGRVQASNLREVSRGPPCTPPPPPAGTGRARGSRPGRQNSGGPFPCNSTFFRLERVSISTAEPFPIVKIKRKCALPAFIFSRFQCGKQIRALKHLVLAGGRGEGGSFLLIKNKLSRAPWRSGCAGLSAPRATRGYRGPWGPPPARCGGSPPPRTPRSLRGPAPSPFHGGYQNICFSLKENININKCLASASRFLPCFPDKNPHWGAPWVGLNLRTSGSALPP